VVRKLWNSWDHDALTLDKAAGQFADPAKVRYIDHRGEWLKVRGQLQVPRSPQGEPVILQAGLSERGKRFAGRWADAVFTISPNLGMMQSNYRDIKAQVAAAGRDPEQTKVFAAIMPVLGETEAIAKERLKYTNSLVHPEVGLSSLSSHVNVDLAKYSLDTPLAEVLRGLKERNVPTQLNMFAKCLTEKGLSDFSGL
jgi:alkanesulfonate monooxygenase SsuD/methylene tetrahydromethanopterin reductase-like flavin-dependent oxidoreductase (luciferase family)